MPPPVSGCACMRASFACVCAYLHDVAVRAVLGEQGTIHVGVVVPAEHEEGAHREAVVERAVGPGATDGGAQAGVARARRHDDEQEDGVVRRGGVAAGGVASLAELAVLDDVREVELRAGVAGAGGRRGGR